VAVEARFDPGQRRRRCLIGFSGAGEIASHLDARRLLRRFGGGVVGLGLLVTETKGRQLILGRGKRNGRGRDIGAHAVRIRVRESGPGHADAP
jgi:hypothetical protein